MMSEAHPDPCCSKWKKGFNFYNCLVFDASCKEFITEKQIKKYDFDYCPFCGAKLIPYPRAREKQSREEFFKEIDYLIKEVDELIQYYNELEEKNESI